MLKNIIYIKIVIWQLYIINKYVITCKYNTSNDDTSNEFVMRSIITFTSANSSCPLLYAALIYASDHA